MADASVTLQDFIPPELAASASAAIGYYNQVQDGLQNISVTTGSNGWPVVTLSPKATAIISGVVNGVVYTVPVIGQAYALLMALAPQAGAGPGVCSTDPPHVADPKAPTSAELYAWPHFQSWQSSYGPYAMPPNSFEAFANPILQWNWELLSNCFFNAATPMPVVLAALIHSWNQAHSNTTVRTVTRSGLIRSGWGLPPSGYDPISNALETALQFKYNDGTAFGYTGPTNASTGFQINDGPVIVKPVVLHMPAPTQPAAVATTTKAVAKTAAVAGGSAVVAGILWGLATGKAWDWAFSTAWSEIKDIAGAKEAHSLFESATIGAAEDGAVVQSVLLSRQKYDVRSAKAWARAHGYRSGKVDVTGNYIHVVQRSPDRFRRIRTKRFNKYILAHVGPLK